MNIKQRIRVIRKELEDIETHPTKITVGSLLKILGSLVDIVEEQEKVAESQGHAIRDRTLENAKFG
jgi:hypothetical protein